MTREEAFEFLDRTARGIAEMFGSSCETLVHDMGDPRHPILSIYNGHVSGRTVGSTLDILGTAKELDHDALVTDFVNLYATTPSLGTASIWPWASTSTTPPWCTPIGSWWIS